MTAEDHIVPYPHTRKPQGDALFCAECEEAWCATLDRIAANARATLDRRGGEIITWYTHRAQEQARAQLARRLARAARKQGAARPPLQSHSILCSTGMTGTPSHTPSTASRGGGP